MRAASILLLPALCLVLALGCEDRGEGPVIRSLTPDFGSTHGGDTLTVSGEGFAGPLTVTVAGRKAHTVEPLDEHSFLLTVPPGEEGLADVCVTLADGSRGEVRQAFLYQDPAFSPQLVMVSPCSGLHEGGYTVTLTGGNFQAGARVLFGGLDSPDVQVLGASLLTAVTPRMPIGALDVVVENPDGRKAWMPQAFTSECLTDQEQVILDLVNQERAGQGLPPLSADPSLCTAARLHSQDMIDRDFFDHQNPDGLWPEDRVSAQGYAFHTVGENIAAGDASPYQTMATWMASPGHRANILDPDYQHIGIGRKTGGTWGIYWTQVFARPR